MSLIHSFSQVDLLGVEYVIEKMYKFYEKSKSSIYAALKCMSKSIDQRAQLNESHVYCEFQKLWTIIHQNGCFVGALE